MKKKPTEDDPIFDGVDVEVEGNYPSITRTRTGLFSLDHALSLRGELGMPTRLLIELYGYTNTGKSTLAYFLAGRIAKANGGTKIGICDVEMLDRDQYLPTAVAMGGFKGKVTLIDIVDAKTSKPMTHEKMLMNLCVKFQDETMPAVIWDSVGATQSLVEVGGEFGEAFMGKKAKLVSQVVQSLRTVLITKETPSNAIAINHVHSIMGAGRGHTTTGGERIKFLSGVRMMLWSEEVIRVGDDDKKPIGFVVAGTIEKLRQGARGGEFGFYIVPGFGVHPGASAMFDAFRFGLAERDARVKLNGKSMGFLKADLLAYAAEGRNRKFEPFIEEIDKYAHKFEKGEI